ncbi:hypothetical protein F441_13056 [Phytophthora nicotianae CJ01A1]|uniref:Uncharacterized protein n=6 Tax=Phytophthora nicotianae TaxID=4792 RepID=W2R3S6_PHYN3|nr:hypothetical protein PPTG_21220 [Phytophthora nicotianae INRA-310]ETI41693.1 hypothetical protein F443_13095 [Phytophthora nicotianae P1569]ETK81724.1 hypothetical protein L915_12794 [Phytophthora nicotianae]ETO70316.1 hypothetical protein F444_13190 [Phytophthora nicotianae P1976]ETP11425.1 hypothetical protein F441_13056 [Phytophthora nicotianae CJ01A1]ETP39557.1 hypothetical protein F442_12987 [Phytophthora nicotianae P10297]
MPAGSARTSADKLNKQNVHVNIPIGSAACPASGASTFESAKGLDVHNAIYYSPEGLQHVQLVQNETSWRLQRRVL